MCPTWLGFRPWSSTSITQAVAAKFSSLSSSGLILAYITAWLWSETYKTRPLSQSITGLKPPKIIRVVALLCNRSQHNATTIGPEMLARKAVFSFVILAHLIQLSAF